MRTGTRILFMLCVWTLPFVALAQSSDKGTGDSLESLLADYYGTVNKLKTLAKQHPGVQGIGYTKNAAAKESFDAARQRKKSLVKRLPLRARIEIKGHLRKKMHTIAFEKVDLFSKAWINVILPDLAADAGAAAGAKMLKEADVSSIVALEILATATYLKAGHGKEPLSSKYRVPANMVYVPGGYYLMGRRAAKYHDNDFPMHVVFLSPYFIDRYEVSNANYSKFLRHMRRNPDAESEHPDAPPMKSYVAEGSKDPLLASAKQPVVGIDWFDAYAFAKWAGKRLPTEAEWEKAARGMSVRRYTWGKSEPAATVVNCPSGRAFLAAEIDRQNPAPKPRRSLFERMGVSEKPPPPPKTSLPAVTWSVYKNLPPETLKMQKAGRFKWSRPSVSPYSVFHMAGNVAEWVSDRYDGQYYRVSPLKDPTGPEKGNGQYIFRGGSYLSPDTELIVTWRGVAKDEKLAEGLSSLKKPMIGLRCAKSLAMSREIR